MADGQVTGWFVDPFQRHENRWMSSGLPTPLVRDGSVESNDPVGEVSPLVSPTRIEAVETPSKERPWGWCFVLLGLIAIIGGGYLLLQQSSGVTSHRFVPAAAESAGPGAIKASTPPDCVGITGSSDSGQSPVLGITSNDADKVFTVPSGDEVVIENKAPSLATFSANAPVCLVKSDVVNGMTVVGYLLDGSGQATIYVTGAAGRTGVVKIDAATTSPSSLHTLGWAVLILGILAILFGCAVLLRRGDEGPSDLRRVGQDPKDAPYDAQRAQRAAWDALDQSAGQW